MPPAFPSLFTTSLSRLLKMPSSWSFGQVTSISHQVFPSQRDISTGTHIVKMSLNQHVPFEMTITGYPCQIWYRGQPVKCVICNGAHKAGECQIKQMLSLSPATSCSKRLHECLGYNPPNPNPPVPPCDVPTNPPPAPGPSRPAAPPGLPLPANPPDPPPPLMSIVVPDHSDQDSHAPLF